MTEQKLLQMADRCRRLARLCKTAAVARKFEALALDYEEYARVHRRHTFTFEVLEPDTTTEHAVPITQQREC
jgi:hypothetical protein